ncbi:TIGR00645 family protein [Legionella yabuuchiae]|uniref:TIGR00645 family protein n=1 Tax=Legionella yabuuchiae TaxID=376727 RepID=UPI001056C59B|nr:TIGR00645 family protein [Legionella yabuuchiae]
MEKPYIEQTPPLLSQGSRRFVNSISQIIFMGRWLQAPLYLGLIFILTAYVYRFMAELFHLMAHITSANDTQIMLGVLDLIDVVMIANLLIMVIMGGYETFVSRLNIDSHPDQPEWLDHLDAGAMKIKLALSLIGISSIHLLRTFIEPSKQSNDAVMWQVIIHLTLLISALTIAYTNRLLNK